MGGDRRLSGWGSCAGNSPEAGDGASFSPSLGLSSPSFRDSKTQWLRTWVLLCRVSSAPMGVPRPTRGRGLGRGLAGGTSAGSSQSYWSFRIPCRGSACPFFAFLPSPVLSDLYLKFVHIFGNNLYLVVFGTIREKTLDSDLPAVFISLFYFIFLINPSGWI